MKMHQVSPILWTKDLQGTINFYETVLGFKAVSNFPNFVSLSHGNVQVMFVCPDEDEPFDKPFMTGDLYIFTDAVDELWNAIQGKARIKMDICDREYYMRDFSILDNNGYEICFGQNTLPNGSE